jgi:hypothetical protein
LPASHPIRNNSANPPSKLIAIVNSAISAPSRNTTNRITSVQMTVVIPPISVQMIATSPMIQIDAMIGLTPVAC